MRHQHHRFLLVGLLSFLLWTIQSFAAINPQFPVEKQYEAPLWNFNNYGQPYRIDSQTKGLAGKPNADIGMIQAWTLQSQATEIPIAIIDGQFDLQHPDLIDVWDESRSWSFLTQQKVVSPHDESPHHGTMIAGVIGANGTNDFGITGIIQKSHLIPIEILPESGTEKEEDIANAILWAVKQGARIINCSFGNYSTSKAVEEAIVWAQKNKVLIVTSAGNDGINVDKKTHWPSAYSTTYDNVISVASTNRSDKLSVESNFGTSIDMAAPGHEIFTTGNPVKTITRYSSFTGTSAAAPHVTGVAGLMLAANPYLTPAAIKKILKESSDPLYNQKGVSLSFGRINAFRALQTVVINKDLEDKNSSSTLLLQQHFNNDQGTSQKPIEGLSECSLGFNKQEYLRSSTKIGFRWIMKSSSDLYLSWNGEDPLYQKYKEWVLSRAPGDYRAILQTHIEAGRRILQRLKPNDPFAQEIIESEKQVLNIINKVEGSVHPLNCMESLVFREFLKYQSSIASTREFLVNIFQRGEQIQILGEWQITPADSTDFIGAGSSKELASVRAQLLSQGWSLLADFHNHPFSFDNEWGDIGGGLAPSSTDLQSYRRLKPSSALITNGIETIRFDHF